MRAVSEFCAGALVATALLVTGCEAAPSAAGLADSATTAPASLPAVRTVPRASQAIATTAQPAAALAGGETTVFDTTINAFSLPASNLAPDQRRAFFVGNTFFNDNWVVAPASTAGRDGLGPTFNAPACTSCHFKDGRAAPPADSGDGRAGLLFRLSVPGSDAHGGPLPEPRYGGQLNDRGIPGVPAEGRMKRTVEPIPGSYADGERYELERPEYAFEDLAFGPMDPAVLTSPRVAPAMPGLGLLEALPEAAILAHADPEDADGDGISGRPNRVWDQAAGATRLGRFGWKANQPTIEQQVAGAFLGDIGITSRLNPAPNCPDPQSACRGAPIGGAPELDDHKLERVTHYSQTLAVPAQRGLNDPEVRRGEALFAAARCTACHLPELRTGPDAADPALADQVIHPYTDLLLHDMGEGLADGRPDYLATGSEWRTPPLWGIGLVKTVNGHTRFLHDGRARDLAEAILWHGGEATATRDAFRALSSMDRAALLRFLDSL